MKSTEGTGRGDLRDSVRFNGLRKASPEFHSRAGQNRSKEAGATGLGLSRVKCCDCSFKAQALMDQAQDDSEKPMNSLTTHHLSSETVQRFLKDVPEYVKVALTEKSAELDCSIEGVVEMAIASFLDEEAFSFEDCLLAQRSQP